MFGANYEGNICAVADCWQAKQMSVIHSTMYFQQHLLLNVLSRVSQTTGLAMDDCNSMVQVADLMHLVCYGPLQTLLLM